MNIPLPGFGGGQDSSSDTGAVIISDVIGKDRAINIFAGFTRDIASISKRLNDDGCNSTVLAPLNSEIQKLPRKPWEDPKDYGALGQSAYEGSAGEDRAHTNLRRFVEAHILAVSPWEEGEKIKSIGGEELWWENRGGTRTVRLKNSRSYFVRNIRGVIAHDSAGDTFVSALVHCYLKWPVNLLKDNKTVKD
ncbi:MAG: hypothetical protein LQ346_001012 [Caloplaca aetnensis]|nr:MAG: hypothetical protein LQ346_001012 [Caloplaca aetnensis]